MFSLWSAVPRPVLSVAREAVAAAAVAGQAAVVALHQPRLSRLSMVEALAEAAMVDTAVDMVVDTVVATLKKKSSKSSKCKEVEKIRKKNKFNWTAQIEENKLNK